MRKLIFVINIFFTSWKFYEYINRKMVLIFLFNKHNRCQVCDLDCTNIGRVNSTIYAIPATFLWRTMSFTFYLYPRYLFCLGQGRSRKMRLGFLIFRFPFVIFSRNFRDKSWLRRCFAELARDLSAFVRFRQVSSQVLSGNFVARSANQAVFPSTKPEPECVVWLMWNKRRGRRRTKKTRSCAATSSAGHFI